MRDIHERKRLKGKEHVLDHMGSTELAANLFCATQTEEKLRRENVRNKDQARRIHEEVRRKVRKTIHELGGTMPENLPVAESVKKVESRERKRLKAEKKKALQNPPAEGTGELRTSRKAGVSNCLMQLLSEERGILRANENHRIGEATSVGCRWGTPLVWIAFGLMTRLILLPKKVSTTRPPSSIHLAP
jgi:hypothetical protein